MPYFILETEDGWTVGEMPNAGAAEEVAAEAGGTVIDPGPYDTYDDANDALVSLADELGDEDGSSDVPGTRAIESRETE